MALEKEKVIFHIYDSDVRNCELTRMPHTLEPTLEAVTSVVRAAAHFYWHRRRTLQTDRGILAERVKVEVTELELMRIEYGDELNCVGVPPVAVKAARSSTYRQENHMDGILSTIARCCYIQRSFTLTIATGASVSIIPSGYDDADIQFLASYYYVPPIARGKVEPLLKGEGYFTVGYGDSGSVPHTFFLRKEQDVDVGILKLFLSRKQVDLSHIAQPSSFIVDGLPRDSTEAVLPEPTDLPLPWDTIEILVVQRNSVK